MLESVIFMLQAWIKKNWLIILFLTLLVFIAYANCLGNEFVSDDIAAILKNENLEDFGFIASRPLGAGCSRSVLENPTKPDSPSTTGSSMGCWHEASNLG